MLPRGLRRRRRGRRIADADRPAARRRRASTATTSPPSSTAASRPWPGSAPPARIVQRSLPPESGDTTALDVLGAAHDLHPRLDHPAARHDRRVRGARRADRGDREEDDGRAHPHRLDRRRDRRQGPLRHRAERRRGARAAGRSRAATPPTSRRWPWSSCCRPWCWSASGSSCAGLFKTQQQVNTWSGVILLPLLAPGLHHRHADAGRRQQGPLAPAHRATASASSPTPSRAARSTRTRLLSFAMLLAWAVGAYGFLWWRLSRREAV